MIKKGERKCPFCGGRIQPRGHVKRKLKLGDGEIMIIKLRRFSCKDCGRWHREIPNDILPYKHYPKPIIEKFANGELNDSSFGYENYPCEETIQIWASHIKQRH